MEEEEQKETIYKNAKSKHTSLERRLQMLLKKTYLTEEEEMEIRVLKKKKLFYKDIMERAKEKIEKGGFLLCHWDGTTETELKIKEDTKATLRCIPLDGDETPGVDMVTGKPSKRRVIFARAY